MLRYVLHLAVQNQEILQNLAPVDSQDVQYCGSYAYNINEYQCCENFQLCRKDGSHFCCGKHCQDITVSLCCSNKLVDKCSVFNSQCCGLQCFNNLTKICCDNAFIQPKCAGQLFSSCCQGTCYDIRFGSC